MDTKVGVVREFPVKILFQTNTLIVFEREIELK